jgi:hypothetical protein
MSSINAIPDKTMGLLVTSGDNTATLNFQTSSITALNIGSNQNANCTSTGAIRVSVGNTAQRPASPVNGMIRLNTTIQALEGYANNTWVAFI